jgi:hypothetical protein
MTKRKIASKWHVELGRIGGSVKACDSVTKAAALDALHASRRGIHVNDPGVTPLALEAANSFFLFGVQSIIL